MPVSEAIQQQVKIVREKAIELGAGVIPYSQMFEPTATLINTMPATKSGICRALCLKWIAEHAHDSSLWNWLFAKGTTNVQQAKIGTLMINFIEGVTPGANSSIKNPNNLTAGDFQDLQMDKYLALNGLVRRSLGRPTTRAYKTGALDDFLGYKIANAMNPKNFNSGGSYQHIYIGGPAGAHSICAFVSMTGKTTAEVAFFDPNFGEFYFTDFGNFAKFMHQLWWYSGYRKMFSNHQIDDFGIAMKRR